MPLQNKLFGIVMACVAVLFFVGAYRQWRRDRKGTATITMGPFLPHSGEPATKEQVEQICRKLDALIKAINSN